MYKVEVIGIEECAAYFDDAAGDLPSAVSIKLEQVCVEMAEYAKALAPKKTGQYAASIYVRMIGPMTFIIGASAPHAPIIEWGSMPHFIYPRFRKALKFEVDGETVFAKWVHHPGTPPLLILHRAKKEHLPKIVQAVRDGVNQALRR